MLMMMTMAKGIAAAPARSPAQPTQMDIAQFSKEGRGPTNNATAMRNRRFQKSLSALEMEHALRLSNLVG